MLDRETLIYKMAFAIYSDRKDQPWQETGGFMPWWTADLQLAEIYSPESVGVNFKKWVWWRRALTYLEAKNHSYKFESKK